MKSDLLYCDLAYEDGMPNFSKKCTDNKSIADSSDILNPSPQVFPQFTRVQVTAWLCVRVSCISGA